MREEDKKRLLESEVKRSDLYQGSIKKIKDALQKSKTDWERLLYLDFIRERLNQGISAYKIARAESTEPADSATFNLDEMTLYLVLDYVTLLFEEYSKYFEIPENSKEIRKSLKTEIQASDDVFGDLHETTIKKLELLLSKEENNELRDYINGKRNIAVSPLQDEDQKLLKKGDVMKMFSVSQVTVNAWMKKGILNFHKVGRQVYFKKSDIDTLLISKPNIGKKRKD